MWFMTQEHEFVQICKVLNEIVQKSTTFFVFYSLIFWMTFFTCKKTILENEMYNKEHTFKYKTLAIIIFTQDSTLK